MGDHGLSHINKVVTKGFLTLDNSYVVQKENLECSRYIYILQGFEKLCNLNIRDREYARQIISNLFCTDFSKKYHEITAALSQWCQGNIDKAREHFATHNNLFPNDFAALFMQHMFDFLHGRSDLYSEYLLADQRCEDPDFGSFYKGMLAFSMCEQGKFNEALNLALNACKTNITDVYSIHALIHCWQAFHEHDKIIDFLQENIQIWKKNPGMNIHLKWHLSISFMEQGRFREAISAYRDFRSFSAGNHAEQDLDAVNFCLRLFYKYNPRPEFLAEHVQLAHNWAPSIFNSLSYFNDIHAAMAFMLAGDRDLMAKLMRRPDIAVFDSRTCQVGREILCSINDFLYENYEKCIERLEDTKSDWYRIGGSWVQREILSILLETAKNM